jgi:hypothetical protein
MHTKHLEKYRLVRGGGLPPEYFKNKNFKKLKKN